MKKKKVCNMDQEMKALHSAACSSPYLLYVKTGVKQE